MGAQQTRPDSFVIRLQGGKGAGDAVAESLRDVGTVATVSGHDSLMVVHIGAPAVAEAEKAAKTEKVAKAEKAPKPKSSWERLRKLVGAHGVVQPVLTDDSGNEQLPTGEISVRFKTQPTDAALAKFAASHDLKLLARNEYVAQQAVFAPIHPEEQYLPEVIQSVMSAKTVELAWANTLGQYKRLTRA